MATPHRYQKVIPKGFNKKPKEGEGGSENVPSKRDYFLSRTCTIKPKSKKVLILTMIMSHMATGNRKHVAEAIVMAWSRLLS